MTFQEKKQWRPVTPIWSPCLTGPPVTPTLLGHVVSPRSNLQAKHKWSAVTPTFIGHVSPKNKRRVTKLKILDKFEEQIRDKVLKEVSDEADTFLEEKDKILMKITIEKMVLEEKFEGIRAEMESELKKLWAQLQEKEREQESKEREYQNKVNKLLIGREAEAEERMERFKWMQEVCEEDER